MNARTGKECKRIDCANYSCYSNWIHNLGSKALSECVECKHAHVSQYHRKSLK